MGAQPPKSGGYHMKKIFSLLLCLTLILSLFSGCGQKAETEITLEEAGLSYTIPDEWAEGDNVNLMPFSYVSPESSIYAKVTYQYAPDENLDELNDLDSEIPIEELMVPLFEFIVVKEENLESEEVAAEKALFHSCEELPSQEEYHFFLLWEPTDGLAQLTPDAGLVYTDMEDGIPAFKETVKTFVPTPAENTLPSQEEVAAEDEGYFNFISTDLDGNAVASTMFYDYDITMVNFWASYAYPDINELDQLEELYTRLQEEHPNVNMIQVIIDTPDDEAEEVIAKAYAESGVTFTGISPDKNMASWILENLEGLPTTIFVDDTGFIIGDTIEKVQTADYYMTAIEDLLAQLDKE